MILAAGVLSCSSPGSSAPDVRPMTDAGEPPRDASAGAVEGGTLNAPDSSADAADANDWTLLFDGTLSSDWRMSTIRNQPGRDDPGHFSVEGGALVTHPGTDLGLLWNTRPTPASFVLELDWKLSSPDDNSGIFVRFPDPESKGYDNSAWVAINFGFEIQINEPGVPDGAPEHTTGAVYGAKNQAFSRVVANPPGSWNTFSIRVEGHVYTVTLNGRQVTRYTNDIAGRGAPSAQGAPTYVGLQTHTGQIAFRNVRIRALP